MAKYYSTKYVASKGILVVEGVESITDTNITYITNISITPNGHFFERLNDTVFATLEEATRKAETDLLRKVQSLRKQIAKLEKRLENGIPVIVKE